MLDDREYVYLNKGYTENTNIIKKAIDDAQMHFWDYIIITAASTRQAAIYEKLLDYREKKGFIPKQTKFFVLPDRNGERIGSGGSTILALIELFKRCQNDISELLRRKTLILHSGGDAKRMPHAAPFGKLFSFSGVNIGNMIKNPPATIFDDLMVSFAGLPSRMNGGIVVASADAFFRFFTEQIDLDLSSSTAFAMKADALEGTQHGVFYERNKSGIVDGFFHKLPLEELCKMGAVSDGGLVDLDIGLTYFGEELIRKLLGMVIDDEGKVTDKSIESLISGRVRLSLYEDLISPMASDTTLESYIMQEGDGKPSKTLLELRPQIYQKLHNLPLKLCVLRPGRIQNMGTSRETLQVREFLIQDRICGDPHYDISLISECKTDAVIGKGCFIENSEIQSGVQVGDNCLISNCTLRTGAKVPDRVSLSGQKLLDGRWVCRVWGIDDDIKSKNTWINRHIDMEDWDSGAQSLWDAKLFPICNTEDEALDWAFTLMNEDISLEDKKAWKRTERVSFADTDLIDVNYLLERRADREDRIRVDAFVHYILNGKNSLDLIDILGTGEDISTRIKRILKKADSLEIKNWQDKMRLYFCLAEVMEIACHDFNVAEEIREKGRLTLIEATKKYTPHVHATNNRRWKKKKTKKELPIRVNFGGTWSDAPPYCFEHGGTMLNAAVAIDGILPINVTAEVTDELSICFENIRDNTNEKYTELESLISFSNPSDPYILFKSSLYIAGVLKIDSGSLQKQLEILGGGVKISTDVDIPKGSGLGTSSIIVAGMLDVLYQLFGVERSCEELSDDVLLAEQLMTTGGGWQDAIGGIFPGIKLTYTQPGIPQTYDVSVLSIPECARKELNERGFLLYTGQRRLAREVLRKVTGNYICNHKESIEALEMIQQLAVEMSHALKHGRISGFGRMLSNHMNLLKKLDLSSTNTTLDYMSEELSEYAEGVTLCGAAGGGFMYGVLKNGFTIDDLQKWSDEKFNGSAIAHRAIIAY